MSGAFQTSRDIFSNAIWNDVPKFRIFFYIYGNAVFSEKGATVGGIKLERGQLLKSYRNLRDDLQYMENRAIKKYSLSLIKRKVDQLVKEERLKIEDTELGTLFTVVNYSLYQGLDNYKRDNENAERTQREQNENAERTNRERSENNNKNVNKDKNVKDIYSVFEHWNSKGIIKHRSLTDARKSKINARLKEISTDEIKQAIDNYSDILASDFHYWTHKWTLEEFMNPRNIERFMSENNPFENFRNTRKERKKEADRSNPVANGYYFDWSKEVERLENANKGS